jgi:uncharacterized alkaline shock family protein YloU
MSYFGNVFKIMTLCCVILYTGVFIVGGAFFVISSKATFEEITVDGFIQSFWGKVVGVLGVVIGLAFISAQYLATKKEDCIAFDSSEGEVIIAVSAIEDFVKRLANSFWEVKDALPTIEPRDDGVAVEMKVVLWDDKNIQDTTTKIQKTVKNQIQSFFGLANVHQVKVFVVRTVSREAAPEKGAVEKEGMGPEEEGSD